MNNRKQKGFEETEIRNQGLSALVKDGDNLSVSTDQVGVIVNNNVSGTFYDLPDDHMYTIYEECTIDKKECDTGAFIVGWVNVVAHNEMQRYNWSKYKKPFYRIDGNCRVWRSEFSREVSARLDEAAKILNNVKGIAFTHFESEDVVRHPLVQRIVNAYAAARSDD